MLNQVVLTNLFFFSWLITLYTMSVSFKVVLAAIFPEVFQYDDEYDELFGNTKLNILNYPYPIRKLFYDYYDVNMDKNKMLTKNDIDNFMNNDKELLYVKNPVNNVVWYNSKTKQVEYIRYNHFIEQDYKYKHVQQNVRNHMTLKYIVFYDEYNDFNINNYIANNMYPKNERYDKVLMSRIISYDNIFKYYNEINKQDLAIKVIIERFLTDENKLINFTSKLTDNELKLAYYESFISKLNKFTTFDYNKWKYLYEFDKTLYPLVIKHYKQYVKMIDTNNTAIYQMVKHGMLIADNYKYNVQSNWFRVAFVFVYKLKDTSLLTITESMLNQYISCCESDNVPLQVDIINKFDVKYTANAIVNKLSNIDQSIYKLKALPFIINKYNIFKYVNDIKEHIEYIDEHKQQFDNYPMLIFCCLIEVMRRYENTIKININDNTQREHITKDDIKDYIEKYKEVIDYYVFMYENHTIGYYWVKYVHDEPFYTIYPSPLIDNLAVVWKQHYSVPPPKEMVDIKFYNYMMKYNGVRRPQNITAFYSYFSNSNENKFIFINNDNVLENEARLRYIIPVNYQQVKTFLTEELETNDICLFTKISDKDWQKIAGGNDRIDCVVFSDWADVFRHRTTPSKLIKYFKEAIELKFNVVLKDEIDSDEVITPPINKEVVRVNEFKEIPISDNKHNSSDSDEDDEEEEEEEDCDLD